MDLLKPTLKLMGDRHKLELVFELVDHPSYGAVEASLIKPVDIWFRMLSFDTDTESLTEADIVNKGRRVLNITKHTATHLRTFSDHYRREKAKLCVVAKPTELWSRLYEPYIEEWQVDVPGRYNIPVWNAATQRISSKLAIKNYSE
ncbi:hypothetical protein Tel_12035 [Candidatus Tenderia electrophaga]|uniref:Uncharacterized protein n=1 Tax=Candidatus Tenderia electrophaga TaxID=1748243 RepID=A0A0S2TF97_9GAMM|nr:hypothetical protein Tel_12035 [Candidatus Tenderia electrophaga]